MEVSVGRQTNSKPLGLTCSSSGLVDSRQDLEVEVLSMNDNAGAGIFEEEVRLAVLQRKWEST
jgi:hypothetical protein